MYRELETAVRHQCWNPPLWDTPLVAGVQVRLAQITHPHRDDRQKENRSEMQDCNSFRKVTTDIFAPLAQGGYAAAHRHAKSANQQRI